MLQLIVNLVVTDMLVAVLNTCTKEELEESDEEMVITPVSPIFHDSGERKKIIKNKIMAVGRMARVFALLRLVHFSICPGRELTFIHPVVIIREESEKVSELKSVSGSNKLPYGTLASGSEGIKDAINGFDDAYVLLISSPLIYLNEIKRTPVLNSRKSDIENERLPPELFDADSEEGKAFMSQPSTPEERDTAPPPVSPNGVAAGIEAAISKGAIPSNTPPPSYSPSASPVSPTSVPTGMPFRRGHSRQASLGTTMTSPSTRRRSLESTMSLIQGVWDGQERGIPEGDELSTLTDQLAGSSVNGGGGRGSAQTPR